MWPRRNVAQALLLGTLLVLLLPVVEASRRIASPGRQEGVSDATAGWIDGASGGAKRVSGKVEANGRHVWSIRSAARQYAEAWIDGSGDSDLDCYVYGPAGDLLDADTGDSDLCLLRWLPRTTSTFRIVVRNLGGVQNSYELTTD